MLPSPPIEYSAPATCPDANDFHARVDARIAGAPEASPPVGLRSLRVEVEDQPGSYVGRLTVRDEDGTESTREVSGTSCAELVDALAFMSAVSIGLVEPPTADAGATPSPPVAPSSPPVPRESPPPIRPPEPWRFTVGVHALASSVFGSVELGPAVFAELGQQGERVWAPAVRVSAFRVGSGTVGVATGGDATLTLTTGRVEVCPVRFPPGTLWLRPCAGFELGDLNGSGAHIPNAQSGARFWAAADVLARLQAALLDWMIVELQGGASIPLIRHEFYFAPNATIYDVPTVAGLAEVGLGLRLP